MTTNPEPVAATPSIRLAAPAPNGRCAGAQLTPPLALSQTLFDTEVTACFPRPCVLTTGPAAITRVPRAATRVSASTRPPGAARFRLPPESRRQVSPSADVQATGLLSAWWPPGTFAP